MMPDHKLKTSALLEAHVELNSFGRIPRKLESACVSSGLLSAVIKPSTLSRSPPIRDVSRVEMLLCEVAACFHRTNANFDRRINIENPRLTIIHVRQLTAYRLHRNTSTTGIDYTTRSGKQVDGVTIGAVDDICSFNTSANSSKHIQIRGVIINRTSRLFLMLDCSKWG